MTDVTAVQNLDTPDERPKLTPAEALARVGKNETMEMVNCPHCHEPIAVYVPKVLAPQTSDQPKPSGNPQRPAPKHPGHWS